MDDLTGRAVVCVDLDGVLNIYDGWRSPEFFHPVRPGAREFLQSLKDAGFTVVVFTVRHAPWVEQWLIDNGLRDLVFSVTDRKPPAHVYLDDRAVCFEGDFRHAFARILTFQAHWEEAPPAAEHADLSKSPPA